MPIFCSGVNPICEGKLVPITRHNDAAIVPDTYAIALDLVERGPESGALWESERYANHLRVDVL